ncbi:phosphotransferase enzyme family protein [candidate division KSB3 bacterium]|uniref:Phosphotransferase enzyme family protein n=1 Tax=candidate division KSB3 bacterium TaxID=2044937 RepID=A0A2G6E9Z2_9BACT|nr:MAG: phosphotransferase enzyme family protein [candidate division KSB3 bacterium]PIE29027.1 MAG: phosphotransferase enzyme family protein [candidate division KSB3 bacterium]
MLCRTVGIVSLNTQIKDTLIELFSDWAGEDARDIAALPPSGSYREYYRIRSDRLSALGVFNPDRKENVAFLDFSRHFLQKGLPVPAIYADAPERNMYLIQDLGDSTLFSYLTQQRLNGDFPDELTATYKRVLSELPKFQVLAGQDLNYDVCYPRRKFDKQSMLWDLNYFKYYFLKLARIPFDEQDLEDDFQTLTEYLLRTDCDYFMYRDFQSRNIMLYQDRPYFIDYQGGRRGALQYDVASLLFDAKADIPHPLRQELLTHYVQALSALIALNEQEFFDYYYGYVCIRIMQAMGAYGFRGFYEKKLHFLQSVPYALNNLRWLLNTIELPIRVPALLDVFYRLVDSEEWRNFDDMSPRLTVRINSFSYRRGIPVDESGHGGGFVFDCRSLPNPGHNERYRQLDGSAPEEIEFFEHHTDVEDFLQNIYALIQRSVENFQQRNFQTMMVSFGGTGGQHRSVYCAERLAGHLRSRYRLTLTIRHLELEMK